MKLRARTHQAQKDLVNVTIASEIRNSRTVAIAPPSENYHISRERGANYARKATNWAIRPIFPQTGVRAIL